MRNRITDIFGDMADKLVSVRGTVVKASTVKPLVVQMTFACVKCQTNILRIFHDGKFSPPSVCTLHGCKSRTFTPIRSTAQPIDFQKIRQALNNLWLQNYASSFHFKFLINGEKRNLFFLFFINFYFSRLQEILKSENHEEGRVPRTVECELTEDLVDACIPGDVVTVTGIIRQINNYMDIGGGKANEFFDTVISIHNYL